MLRNYETYRSIFCAAKIFLNVSASIFATEQKIVFSQPYVSLSTSKQEKIVRRDKASATCNVPTVFQGL